MCCFGIFRFGISSLRLSLLFLLLAIMAANSTAQAADNHFVENFTTTTYRDAANTTATWNTTAGRLELANHVINQVGTLAATLPGDIKVDGPYIFFLSGSTNLHRLYMLVPGNPVDEISLPVLTDAKGLDVDGGYIYVADGSGGLRIYNRRNFALVGSLPTPGTANHVEVVGRRAFIAAGTSGLVVVDLANPAAPTQIGIVNTPGSAFRVDVEGKYCYVADGSGGMQVIDISVPSAPGVAGAFATGAWAADIVVEGDVAYLADVSNGLVTVDVSDPTAPALLGNLPGIEGASVAVAGNTAFLGRNDDVLQIDVTNPASPAPFNAFYTPIGYTPFLATDGEYVFASDTGNHLLRVLEVLEPSPVTEVAALDPGVVSNAVLEGNTLYATGTGFFSIDVTDPTSPVLLDTLTLGSLTQGFDVEGNYAYVSAFDDGMYVVDVSDPAALVIAGHLPPTGPADLRQTAAVDGDLCLLGSTDLPNHLRIVDVSDPTNPVEIAGYGLSKTPTDIAISGKYAYITLGTAGLDILDISNPLAPVVIFNQPVGDNASSVLVDGDFVYMTSLGEGIYVVDAENPASPYLLSLIGTPGTYTMGLARSGHYLYTGVDGEGLRMYDVSDPGNPVLLSHGLGNNATYPRRMVASGRYVYQCTRSDGIDVLQVMARDFELEDNTGQSLTINTSNHTVYAAKLVSQHSADVSWSLSNNAGGTWSSYFEGTWKMFAYPGQGLRWRVDLGQNLPGVRPTLDQIDIQMAFYFPVITEIRDVPNDQGRQVRVTWQFSGFDVPGSATPILNYAVYRQIDAGSGAVAAGVEPHDLTLSPDLAGWDFISLVPATVDYEYSVVVPTLGDSTVAAGDYQSRFFVRALTASPATSFDSPPDSGYSIDNLAPAAPGNLVLAGTDLSWDEVADTDFNYFTVYGSAVGALDETAVPIGYLTGTTFAVAGQPHAFFHVTATDFSGNEGPATTAGSVSGIGSAPTRYDLLGNVPNPFNPMTHIRFELAASGPVSLVVYGMDGHLVKTVVAGEQFPAGAHALPWDGTDDSGRQVAAGVYLYRLVAGGFSDTGRMTLVK